MPIPASVIVLTFNEEENITQCLDSVVWCDDVVVLDSLSTDHTREIAIAKGARVIERHFDNYANQRNYALKEVKYKYPWVLMLDADELVTEELRQEIESVLSANDKDVTLYRMRRKDYFMGSWLKHSTNYSSLWFGRLLRLGRVWVERFINEEYHTDGETRSMKSALVHYPFSKGISYWVEKHNRYSTMEAELIVNGNINNWRWRELFDSDPVSRRKGLKGLAYNLPGRPLVMFFGRFFVTGGILDGRAGLMFCILKTFYEYLIDCKVRELHKGGRVTFLSED
jgi:glycosyltransferase involved in cell wall biosynthesis